MSFGDRVEHRMSEVLGAIPGYRGYRSKEDRRDADRRVREHLAVTFGAQADRIERVARNLADQRRLREIGPVDDFARPLRHLIDRISTATYGYGGLFGDRDVDERALDQIRLFDEALLEGVDELDAPIVDLEKAYKEGSDTSAPARAGSEVVRNLLERFDLRGQVVETAEPAPEESVLKHLSKQTPAQPPAAYNLHDRDAISILGDNYIVNARIDVQATPDSFRLFRISEEPETWLFVPLASGKSFASLQPVNDPGESETEIGGVAYTTEASGSGTGEVVGAGGRSGAAPVAYRLLTGAGSTTARAVQLTWASERQTLAGKEVHPNDVEIYGARGSGV